MPDFLKIWHFFIFVILLFLFKIIWVNKMKILRIIFKTIFFMALFIDIAVFGSLIYLNQNISEDYKIKKGETLTINTPVPVTAVYNGTELSEKHTEKAKDKLDVRLKMFGIIPLSRVSVEVVDQQQVAVLGTPFGMKIYTKGVLVTDMSAVKTEYGERNPAKDGGIKTGDYITTVNGKKITTNEDLIKIVEDSKGEKMEFKINRNNKSVTLYVTAVKSSETDTYKIGLWVRDSSAGIGTLTFYSPASGVVCGLGHGICDEDTGELLTLDSGEIVTAEIYEVVKGQIGEPGQLKGRFTNEVLGDICLNCNGGIYSQYKGKSENYNLTEIATKSSVKNGKAQILCTIDGTTPEYFDCTVTVKTGNIDAPTQNMTVTVTDEKLLDATGGIVQGLSGSPLLQNGKLIGAVTHVLVDDPTKGYAIFAENMLETAQQVAEEQALKDAS